MRPWRRDFRTARTRTIPEASGVGPSPLNNPNGIRWSTALGYLDPARHRLNLTIRANTLVRRILFEGKRATGVEVESGGERFVVEADEIVLSTGPVCSPHILMLSGVGPSDQIQAQGIPVVHELPGVGQNLRDHPFVPVTFRTKPGHVFNEHDPRLQMMMSWTAEGSHLRNDMIFVVLSYATEEWQRDTSAENVDPVGFRIASGLYLAVGAGEMRLQSSDPEVQPLLDYNYFAEEFDIRRMREGVRLIVSLSEQPALAEHIQERMSPTDADLASDEALDAFIRRNGTTGPSHIGHLQDGASHRRNGGGRSTRPGTWNAGAAGGGRLRHARLHPRQYQRHHHDDWGKDRGLCPQWGLEKRKIRKRQSAEDFATSALFCWN